MNSGFLSQEEINSLLNGETPITAEDKKEMLSDREKEVLGKIGAVSMEAASSTLAMITNQQVNIEAPVVSITTLADFKNNIDVPYMALEVKYVSGIEGRNLLVNKIRDAQVIANLMMGGNGVVEEGELTEIEESAVSEAMNQMIGSSATSMANILSRSVNISPPISKVWRDKSQVFFEDIDENEELIKVSYSMTIGDLVDSDIIQLLPFDTGRTIVGIMESNSNGAFNTQSQSNKTETTSSANSKNADMNRVETPAQNTQPQVEVHQASFQPLKESEGGGHIPKNIDLILDVPLEISVVLGRTKKSIKDILSLGTGSLVELEKLAEDPVEILANGKRVAYGEVVVVGESFGVRVTSIVSSTERVKSLER